MDYKAVAIQNIISYFYVRIFHGAIRHSRRGC